MAGYRGRSFTATTLIDKVGGLTLNDGPVTSTAAQLNILTGATVSATELNKLDEDSLAPTRAPWAEISRWAKCEYTFAGDGGTVGGSPITLVIPIPDNAIVLGGYVEVLAAVTSGGGATLALNLTGAGDLLVATGKASFTLGAVLPMAAALVTPQKLAGAATPSLTVAVADLTAGDFNLWIEYLIGDA